MKAAHLLHRELSDPRLSGVTLTRVEMTADLSRARLYFRVLPGLGDVEAALAAAPAAARFLRREVARTLRLRRTPEIELLHDELPDEAARVDELLASLGEERRRRGAALPKADDDEE